MICKKCDKEIKGMFYIVKRSTSPASKNGEETFVCSSCHSGIKEYRNGIVNDFITYLDSKEEEVPLSSDAIMDWIKTERDNYLSGGDR